VLSHQLIINYRTNGFSHNRPNPNKQVCKKLKLHPQVKKYDAIINIITAVAATSDTT